MGEKIFHGIGVSTKIAIGPAYVIDQRGVPVPEYSITASQVDAELKRLQSAIAKTQKQLAQLRQKVEALPAGASEEIALLLDAHRGMLSGSRLVRGVEDVITNERINAEAAIQRQIAVVAASFAKMGDTYLAARVTDVRDVGARLIRNLQQQQYNPFADAPEGSILVAEEITPADTALMNPDRVSGVAAVFGGAEGHAAIMVRALGIASVLGVAELVGGINSGDTIIIDGSTGTVVVNPSTATLQQYKQEMQKIAREAKKLKPLRDVPAITTDGTPITLHANLELPREVDSALDAGAVGVGLLRTEFMFMNRPDLPSEDEQFETLSQMVKKLDGRMLTVRTLDVGGEKLASALGNSMGESVNPALGLRAVRFGLKQPKIFEAQLSAILRAAVFGPVRILIPMVSSVSQMNKVREHLINVERKLRRKGAKVPSSLPQVGAMIEIPGAALAADALAKVCDFFAIGSNDLTQYTLAIDRGDDRVAELYDPFHPAVLRLIQFTVAAAWRANIPVSLCGEMAANPQAAALLMGLGLREFSMSPANIPIVKQEIVSLSTSQAVLFAEAIMGKRDETAIKALLTEGVRSVAQHAAAARKKL